MFNGYVYKITNNITNQYYIGYRYASQGQRSPQDDLWIHYFTSSKKIHKEIEKNGRETFTPEILFENLDSLVCWEFEQNLIKENWGDPHLLNCKYHCVESKTEHYRRIGYFTKETREKMSLAGKGRQKSEDHKRKIALSNKGKIVSLESREKLSKAKIGKPPTNKGISPPVVMCEHCVKSISFANYKKWHGERCKLINPELFDIVASRNKSTKPRKKHSIEYRQQVSERNKERWSKLTPEERSAITKKSAETRRKKIV